MEFVEGTHQMHEKEPRRTLKCERQFAFAPSVFSTLLWGFYLNNRFFFLRDHYLFKEARYDSTRTHFLFAQLSARVQSQVVICFN